MGTTNTKAVLIDRASIATQLLQAGIEATGSLVAFLLEKFQPEKSGKIVMSGGAARSSFWSQVIADLCELAVGERYISLNLPHTAQRFTQNQLLRANRAALTCLV